jgi:hypothetical protein
MASDNAVPSSSADDSKQRRRTWSSRSITDRSLSLSSRVRSWTKASSLTKDLPPDDVIFRSTPSSIQSRDFTIGHASNIPPTTLEEGISTSEDVDFTPSEVDGRKFQGMVEDKHALEMTTGFDGTDSTYYQTFWVLGQWRADIPSKSIASGCKVPQERETTDRFNQERKYFVLMEFKVTAGTDLSLLLAGKESQWKVAELYYGTQETAKFRRLVEIWAPNWIDRGTFLTQQVKRSVSLVGPGGKGSSLPKKVTSWAKRGAEKLQLDR